MSEMYAKGIEDLMFEVNFGDTGNQWYPVNNNCHCIHFQIARKIIKHDRQQLKQHL